MTDAADDGRQATIAALRACPSDANLKLAEFLAQEQEKAPAAPQSSSKTTASKKRAFTDEQSEEAAVDLDDIDLDGMFIDENCDQVRRKINRFLDSGAMTKTAFAREIGVSVKSLSGFLSEHGATKGSGSATYGAAWEFFKKRELAGLKLPSKRQKTGAAGGAAAAVDLSDIVLPGEDDDMVPVYDTCDEVRRKINAYLKRPGVTQAQFCRDIHAQLRRPDRPARPFASHQLARFRGMKGPLTGCSSDLFYAAYVFFEKLRIKEGRPKTKHRREMEEIWGWTGMERKYDGRQK